MTQSNESPCPCLMELEEFLTGHRADQRINRHVAACPQCRSSLEEIGANSDLMARVVGAELALEDAEKESGTPPDAMPAKISQYQIKRVIASGGMGVVYEAVQEHPHRSVAVKVMKRGLASPSALRRFEYESQVLAKFRHPGIAQVYEAGTYDADGATVPYFAMEYIPNAQTITDFAEGKNLSPRERLELFIKVCDAIHHGHQKGIVHRDLKPSNILVDSQQQPRIIDFGVARSTDSDLAVTTMQTRAGQLIGTLQYMSPEQCEADPQDIDTRSDVYGLGVVLYELLCGRLPYDVTGVAIPEAVCVIRDQRPSSLSMVNKHLGGDVETIVDKALEKDRDRRYPSAHELRRDIERYLTGEPISARPPSVTYQMRKFAQRNKTLVGGAAALFIALVLGVVGTSTGMARAVAAREGETEHRKIAVSQRDRARKAEALAQEHVVEVAEARDAEVEGRRRAEAEAAIATAVNLFLQDMLGAADPERTRGREVTVGEVLDAAARRVEDGALAEQPEIEAAVRNTIGNTYLALGIYTAAEPHLLRALEVCREEYLDDDPKTLTSMSSLGVLYRQQGRLAEAEQLSVETLDARRRALGVEHQDTLNSMNSLALLHDDQGRFEEAETLYLETLEAQRRVLGAEHADSLNTTGNLAALYIHQGRHADAEPLLREVLEVCRRELGDEHPRTVVSMNNLAMAYEGQGRHDKAEPLLKEALQIGRRVFGAEHPDTLSALSNLAGLYHSQGRYAEAEKLYLQALKAWRHLHGSEHASTLNALNNLATLYDGQGRYQEAELLFHEGLEASRRLLGAEHPQTLSSMSNLGAVYLRQGRIEDAAPLFVEALDIRRRVLGSEHPHTLITMINLAVLQKRRGRFAEAERLLADALQTQQRVLGEEHPNTLISMNNLARVYEEQARYDEAERLYVNALEVQRRVLGGEHPHTLISVRNLARLCQSQGRHHEAEPLFREALKARRRTLGHEHPGTLESLLDLAGCLIKAEKFADAEAQAKQCYEQRMAAYGPGDSRTVAAVDLLIGLYDAWGKPDEAASYRSMLPDPDKAETDPE